MDEMVISCFQDGSVQHTLKDSLFRPLQGEPRQIFRMSEVVFDEKHQVFFIQIRCTLRRNKGGIRELHPDDLNDRFACIYFSTYETAVDFEVRFFNGMRRAGWVVENLPNE